MPDYEASLFDQHGQLNVDLHVKKDQNVFVNGFSNSTLKVAMEFKLDCCTIKVSAICGKVSLKTSSRVTITSAHD